MSTPITTIKLYRTQLAQDNVVMDAKTHRDYLNMLSPNAFQVLNCTFQRQNREMRLPISMDVAGRYNYGEFVNNGRTFYCFITDMEYVNDNMTKASYVIDYWHTYQTDVTYHRVMVERAIVPKADDVYCAFTQEEPVSVDKWDIQNIDTTYPVVDEDSSGTWAYFMVDNGTQSNNDIQSYTYGNHKYAAAITQGYDFDTIVNRLKDIVHDNNTLDSVQGVWAIPIKSTIPLAFPNPSKITLNLSLPENPNGVTVRNQKTMISPYCYAALFSSDGEDLTLDLQDISHDGSKQFTFNGNFSLLPKPQMVVYPAYYRDMNNYYGFSVVSCENFPVPNVASSTVTVSNQMSLLSKKWAVGTSAFMALGNVMSSASGVVGLNKTDAGTSLAFNMPGQAQAGNILTTTAASVGNVAGSIISLQEQQRHMKAISGVRGNGSAALWTRGIIGITAVMFVPERDQLQKIDDFFSRYGYTINAIQLPNIHARKKWDYLKTQNAEFAVPNAPVEVENTINQMFDSGLTIWHVVEGFKDYTLLNE